MSAVRDSNERLRGIEPYDAKNLPAKVFLSANENSYDIPADIKEDILREVSKAAFNRYPDPYARSLRTSIAESYSLDESCVLCGNGGDEHLLNIFLAYGGPGRKVLILPPTFSVYAYNANLTGTEVVQIPLREDFSIDEEAVASRVAQGDIDMVIVTSPNNPTGGVAKLEFVRRLLEASDAVVFMDEAYGEFSGQTSLSLLSDHDNLLILHTFSKAFALAGVRMGYLLGSPQVISEICKVRQPYSVDALSQVICERIWESRDVFRPVIERIVFERGVLYGELGKISGVAAYPSKANFLLMRISQAHRVWTELYDRHSVLVRDFSSSKHLDDCLRVTVGTHEENEAFIKALKDVIS